MLLAKVKRARGPGNEAMCDLPSSASCPVGTTEPSRRAGRTSLTEPFREGGGPQFGFLLSPKTSSNRMTMAPPRIRNRMMPTTMPAMAPLLSPAEGGLGTKWKKYMNICAFMYKRCIYLCFHV